MRRFLMSVVVSCLVLNAVGQGYTDSFPVGGVTDQQAKQAVGKIVQYTGLPQNFVVVPQNVKTAVAYIKNKKRYIGYNDGFVDRICDKANTDWAAISVLAHEIAHHLAGHTIDIKNASPGDELEADIFSGFILQQMGATLDEACAAMEQFEPDTASKHHPPKEARLIAITNGWENAKALENTNVMDELERESEYASQPKIESLVTFTRDNNLYYVDDQNRLFWFDNLGNAIVLATFVKSKSNSYQWEYVYGDDSYGIDFKGGIWLMTDHDAVFSVGKMKSYE